MTAEPLAAHPNSPASVGTHWVAEYFRALGTEIERRIQGADLTSDFFADVATAVFEEQGPPRPIDARAVADWMSSGAPLPPQVNFHSPFGHPPLAVYVSKLFYFEVLFWFPSCTSIHGHGFSGAFRVLDGYSIQTTYAFTESAVWDEGLRVGELQPRHVEQLLPGGVCDIRSREAFVHSVVHMGYPSLTLVARTFAESDVTQYDYFRCGVAYAPFRRRRELTRQLDVLLALTKRDPVAAKECIKSHFLRQDEYGRFVTYLRLVSRDDALANEVMEWAAGQWPRTMGMARQVAEEQQRTNRIYRSLPQLPGVQAQLLAALSELFGSRANVMRMLQTSYPDVSPETTLMKWTSLAPTLPEIAPNAVPSPNA